MSTEVFETKSMYCALAQQASSQRAALPPWLIFDVPFALPMLAAPTLPAQTIAALRRRSLRRRLLCRRPTIATPTNAAPTIAASPPCALRRRALRTDERLRRYTRWLIVVVAPTLRRRLLRTDARFANICCTDTCCANARCAPTLTSPTTPRLIAALECQPSPSRLIAEARSVRIVGKNHQVLGCPRGGSHTRRNECRQPK